MIAGRLDWERHGQDWPNRAASRFLDVPYPGAGRLRWHVQLFAPKRRKRAPGLLLLHGTGASSHSFRNLAPLLAERFTVVVPDLPGHAFSALPPLRGLSLGAMARGLTALLAELEVTPALVAGHSAGAAILARMCLAGQIAPAALVGLNAALLPYPGSGNPLFGTAMKIAVWNPVAPRLFAARAAAGMADKILDATGSRIDGPGRTLYRRIAGNAAHCAGALGMMAGWELDPLWRELPKLATPLVLLTGGADRAIPAHHARRVHEHVPGSELRVLPGLGHLAHEEAPELHAEAILEIARSYGASPGEPEKPTVKAT